MAAAALTASGLAVAAYAGPADQFAQHDDFTPQLSPIGPQASHRTLQWNSRTGRWGVDFDVTEPADRNLQWGDTRIGVNYRVAKGLRTGVGVSLGPEVSPEARRFNSDGPQPRVRLQTSFKF